MSVGVGSACRPAAASGSSAPRFAPSALRLRTPASRTPAREKEIDLNDLGLFLFYFL